MLPVTAYNIRSKVYKKTNLKESGYVLNMSHKSFCSEVFIFCVAVLGGVHVGISGGVWVWRHCPTIGLMSFLHELMA